MRLLLLAACVSACLSVLTTSDDTASATPETSWFHAEKNKEVIFDYALKWQGARNIFMVDCFGASTSMSKAFRKRGFTCEAYDILLDKCHDITSESGWFTLFRMVLGLVPAGILIAGPPCSIFVNACVSLHKRCTAQPEGDLHVYLVRLANRIWINFATMIEVLVRCKRQLFYFVEQPAQSWAYKCPWMLSAAKAADLYVTSTWQAFWGHDLPKPTHILSNIPAMGQMHRTMTSRLRLKYQERLRRRNLKRSVPKVYHVKTIKKDGSPGWHGTKHLKSSAAYTSRFADAVFFIWSEAWRNHLFDELFLIRSTKVDLH